MRCINHLLEIGLHLGDGQAAQTIVRAERQNQDAWTVFAQCWFEAVESAGGGVAGNRQIDDAIIARQAGEALFE